MDNIKLNSGLNMPMLGFGTSQIPNDILPKLVSDAISCGYRLIDTASAYDNEEEVGEGIRLSGVPRNELFVTTKLKFWHHKSAETEEECKKSLKRLKMDYVDMFLIHWPVINNDEAWRAMEKLVKEGYVRSIGVCNYHTQHLQELKKYSDTIPAINQLEITPRLQQDAMKRECDDTGIVLQAWSPLMAGEVFRIPELKWIAEKHGVSVAQAVIGWLLNRGISVVSRTTSITHMEDAIRAFDFKPDVEDEEIIRTLDSGMRTGPNPDTFAEEAIEHFDEMLEMEREKEKYNG